ncbi:hypothetical protein AWZ03_007788 [Drosophila navojoa]|uniref:Uncharacterized protein n=1 Tax=Drosophila navojoa TaxID=7232 RepID=A0A484BAK9_DRONA|nr:hypothetical protein AWZ03_007788 [Drosophila navojoa]
MSTTTITATATTTAAAAAANAASTSAAPPPPNVSGGRIADCRKFSPNIFNKSKCSHCFRQREEHSAAALECNRSKSESEMEMEMGEMQTELAIESMYYSLTSSVLLMDTFKAFG